MSIIDSIANRAPKIVADAKAAMRSKRDYETQQAIGQAAPSGDIQSQQQALSAAVAGQQAQDALAADALGQQQALGAQQLQTQQVQQEGQADLATQERQQRESLQGQELAQQEAQQAAKIKQQTTFTERELAQQERLQSMGIDYANQASFLTRKQREDLAALGRDTKAKLFDARLEFEQGEAGRQFSNELQLLDWAASSAENQVAMQNKMREIQQAAQKKVMLLEAAYARISKQLSQASQSKIQEMDQVTTKELTTLKTELEARIRKEKAQAANKAGILGAIGSIVGGMYAGPGGAAAGGAIGTMAANS